MPFEKVKLNGKKPQNETKRNENVETERGKEEHEKNGGKIFKKKKQKKC